MPDLYESPTRVDSNGVPVDLRMIFIDGPQFPEEFLAVSQGGSTAIGTNNGPIAQVTGVTVNAGTKSVSFGFTPLSNADDYLVEYWQTTNPTMTSGLVVTASGVSVPATSGVNYSAHIAGRLESGRGAFTIGPFSSIASGTSS